MSGDRPGFVTFREEGPREGFQIESRRFSVEDRAALVEALAETGLRSIQVASFVNPRKVPQMADAEALFAVIRRRAGVHYDGLWLNEQGFARARATPGVDLSGTLLAYVSDAFARRNNDCSAAEMLERQARWITLYREAGVPLSRAILVTSFGCCFEGEIAPQRTVETAVAIDRLCRDQGARLPEITLADTVGWANPEAIRRAVGLVREALPDTAIGLHLHDTRGLGAANVLAALEMGVDRFDSSVAGLGGCPFAEHGDSGAAGNICTEDMVFLCQELGIETGIDLEKLIEAARLAERIIGRRLNGRLMHAGSLAVWRAAGRPAA